MNQEELEKLSDGELSQLITNLNDYGAFYHFNINNWADMGPLIAISSITLQSPRYYQVDYWSASGDVSDGDGTCECFSSNHTNPLRAAAIVYLLMQE